MSPTCGSGDEAAGESRGAVLGVFGVSGAIGIAVATFFGGEIFDAIGKTAPFLMMVLFTRKRMTSGA